jgi:hypothetical protein
MPAGQETGATGLVGAAGLPHEHLRPIGENPLKSRVGAIEMDKNRQK